MNVLTLPFINVSLKVDIIQQQKLEDYLRAILSNRKKAKNDIGVIFKMRVSLINQFYLLIAVIT